MTDIIGPSNAPNAVTVRPADTRSPSSSDTFFKDCSNSAARDGTAIQASWLNQVTAALRGLARAAGKKLDGLTAIIPEDNSNDNILADAVKQLIQRGRPNYAVDSSLVANAMAISPTPPVAELVDGLEFVVDPAYTNTSSTVTLNVSGLGALNVVRFDGSALQIGDIAASNYKALLIYDSGSNKFLLQNPILGPSAGRTGNFLTVTSTQSVTVPTWATHAHVRIWGPGGGSGGTSTTAGSASSAGGGGDYEEGIIAVTPGATMTATIGAPGTAGAGGGSPTAGGAGGTSSFGGLSAGGGGGGLAANGAIQTTVGSGGSGSGGTLSVAGQGGGVAYATGGAYILAQGGTALQTPNSPVVSTSTLTAGRAGLFPGGGAGGAYLGGAGAIGGGSLITIEFLP